MSTPPDEELEPDGERPDGDVSERDMHEDITRQLALLFPADRMGRIMERLGIEPIEEDVQYLIDLISAIFTRGIEFGAIEVSAQQIEAGQPIAPQIEIAHVELP